jgi:hypothetical protein
MYSTFDFDVACHFSFAAKFRMPKQVQQSLWYDKVLPAL